MQTHYTYMFAYVMNIYLMYRMSPKKQVMLVNKQRKVWSLTYLLFPNEANSLSCNGCPVFLISVAQCF